MNKCYLALYSQKDGQFELGDFYPLHEAAGRLLRRNDLTPSQRCLYGNIRRAHGRLRRVYLDHLWADHLKEGRELSIPLNKDFAFLLYIWLDINGRKSNSFWSTDYRLGVLREAVL